MSCFIFWTCCTIVTICCCIFGLFVDNYRSYGAVYDENTPTLKEYTRELFNFEQVTIGNIIAVPIALVLVLVFAPATAIVSLIVAAIITYEKMGNMTISEAKSFIFGNKERNDT